MKHEFVKLENLRAEVDAMIASEVAERRHELQSQLSELLEITGTKNGARGRGRDKARSVAPKYRNPKNANEVWSGRGRNAALAWRRDQGRQSARRLPDRLKI
jgi:DNA-binding protein H-NS